MAASAARGWSSTAGLPASTRGRWRWACGPGAATLVGLGEREPFLTGLRERGVITDSPRILAEDLRHVT